MMVCVYVVNVLTTIAGVFIYINLIEPLFRKWKRQQRQTYGPQNPRSVVGSRRFCRQRGAPKQKNQKRKSLMAKKKNSLSLDDCPELVVNDKIITFVIKGMNILFPPNVACQMNTQSQQGHFDFIKLYIIGAGDFNIDGHYNGNYSVIEPSNPVTIEKRGQYTLFTIKLQ